VLAAHPKREDVRDAFVSPRYARFDDLPPGARLGTASLRRQAQALHRRPDLQIVMFRGNVQTRLRKLDEGEVDATLLALAGLNRLGLGERLGEALDPLAAPPAPGQGALAIQTRDSDAEAAWVQALHDGPTALALAAERGALEALEGSCRTAMGAYARLEGEALSLVVEALAPNGSGRWREEGRIESADAARAHALGLELGLKVKAAGGARLQLDQAHA
jgi:hydroxymethylbilane synthase